ncbi:MAG: adenylate kinase [Candidatus Azotimanducaceae bacterium]|jgi:adenylate kinase
MDVQTVIFIGPQGSGKGTQVAALLKHIEEKDPTRKLVEVQTGNGFRALAEEGGYTSLRVKNILTHGGLVPDFLTQSIVVNQLIADLTSESHIMMDGFPRNLEQAKFVDELLEFYLRDQITVVYLETAEDVVRERMLARGRSDDNESSINERLRLYKEMTEPLIEHYKNRPKTQFVTVDGAQAIEEVQAEIRAGLEI